VAEPAPQEWVRKYSSWGMDEDGRGRKQRKIQLFWKEEEDDMNQTENLCSAKLKVWFFRLTAFVLINGPGVYFSTTFLEWALIWKGR
jgi:hypothetical protein